MATKSLQILSKHNTVSEAVAAAKVDLSYNEPLALRDLRQLEAGFRGNKSGVAYVTNDGVYYVFHCDINILHKYEPFVSVLDDSGFVIATVDGDTINFTASSLPKNPESRALIAKLGLLVA